MCWVIIMVDFSEAKVFLNSVKGRGIPKELATATGVVAQKVYNTYFRLNELVGELSRIFELVECALNAGAPCYKKEHWETCNICTNWWSTKTENEVTVTRLKPTATSITYNGENVVFKEDGDIEFIVESNGYKLKYKTVKVEVSFRDTTSARKNLDQILYTLRGIEREIKNARRGLENCLKAKRIVC